MSRESEWLDFILHDDFPSDVEFLEGNRSNHVIVRWQVADRDDSLRRNTPMVIVIDVGAINRHETSDVIEQTRIEKRIREIVAVRMVQYDPLGPVDVPEPFVIQIDEGDL
ncbi:MULTISPECIES: hypothetical protein [Burkholderia]|uniref:Uncharacterized protein n=1 Tax=Burkholderia mayonis TaxID=1385591 RepID=A0A1B4FN17_9BURK|nr:MULTISPECIES: hypothetical protein [Burkholderia]AOJ05049.1 hypothetical protein WS70_25315 [Burkholderia mayonis]KVE37157.1 hypothetical protein WS69_03135 [Burkholderia sp. BDU5]KVE45748.1 hypothetical protein WS70_03930 [Burkholderia mayonis]